MQEFNLRRSGTDKELSIAELCGIEPEIVAMIVLAVTGVVGNERKLSRPLPVSLIHRVHDIFEDTVCEKQRVLTEEELVEVALDIAMRELPFPVLGRLQTLRTFGASKEILETEKVSNCADNNSAINLDSKTAQEDGFCLESQAASKASTSGGSHE